MAWRPERYPADRHLEPVEPVEDLEPVEDEDPRIAEAEWERDFGGQEPAGWDAMWERMAGQEQCS